MKKQSKVLIFLLVIMLFVPSIAFIGAKLQYKRYPVDHHLITETYYLSKGFNQIIINHKYFLNVKMPRTNKKAVTNIKKNNNIILATVNNRVYKIAVHDNYFIVDKMKINKAKYFSYNNFLINKNNQDTILLWDYSNINIIKKDKVKSIKLVDEDYDFKLATVYENKFLYFMLDINDYNKVKIVDVNNYKVTTVKLNYKLSNNTRILKNNNNLYLYDLDSNQYYQFKNNQIYLLNQKPKLNTKLFNHQLYTSNNQYGYYTVKDDVIYNKLNKQTFNHFIYQGIGIKNIETINDNYYFIESNKLKKITNNQITNIIVYDELSYNNTQLIFVLK